MGWKSRLAKFGQVLGISGRIAASVATGRKSELASALFDLARRTTSKRKLKFVSHSVEFIELVSEALADDRITPDELQELKQASETLLAEMKSLL